MRPVRLPLCVVVAVALALAVPAAARSVATRTSTVNLTAPAQFNITVAAVAFHAGVGRPLGLALGQAPGLYYVAGAIVRRPVAGGPRALVLAVNERPRGSLAPDRVRLGLRVRAARSLGAPSLHQAVNPFPRAVGATAPPALCGRASGRRTLAAGDLRLVLAAGRPLAGFGGAAAVAEAFDAVCARAYDAAFAQAVTGCTSLVAGCCPPNAMCAVPVTPSPPTACPPTGQCPNTTTPPPTPAPPVCPPCPRPPCGAPIACRLTPAQSLRALACPLTASVAVAC
jgi:hypothetical protein